MSSEHKPDAMDLPKGFWRRFFVIVVLGNAGIAAVGWIIWKAIEWIRS